MCIFARWFHRSLQQQHCAPPDCRADEHKRDAHRHEEHNCQVRYGILLKSSTGTCGWIRIRVMLRIRSRFKYLNLVPVILQKIVVKFSQNLAPEKRSKDQKPDLRSSEKSDPDPHPQKCSGTATVLKSLFGQLNGNVPIRYSIIVRIFFILRLFMITDLIPYM